MLASHYASIRLRVTMPEWLAAKIYLFLTDSLAMEPLNCQIMKPLQQSLYPC